MPSPRRKSFIPWNTDLICSSFSLWSYRSIDFLFFFFIFISWRLITLQYCSGFCYTLTWISHGFTCILHPEPPSHLPPHPIPLGHPSAPAPSTCLMHPTGLAICSTFDNIHVSMLFSQIIPSTPSPTESKDPPILKITEVSTFLSSPSVRLFHIFMI